ncbi:MAG: F0F1 ATP synthase subunit epsilon [Rhodospirillales bacterium CG15_BIG_FIL_POST_REV_8_21_14_020_66_15]|nr:MAG: F0F1 ATP synthase subunit epsilon [Rhodospirillales bacterium CG15_BIG_FIL_POST_REV_8_21_14_020_66_15]
MRLLVTTPVAVVVDADGVRHVRAEDGTGAFGIRPGHADFITVLAVSVITWRDDGGNEHHIAVRGGVLTVQGGNQVEVATREAVGEDTLRALGPAVLKQFQEQREAEKQSSISATRLHLAAIRQLQRYLETNRGPVPQGAPVIAGGFGPKGEPPGEGEVT